MQRKLIFRKKNKAKEKKSVVKESVRDIIDGSFITKESVVRQLPFILFLVLLAILYIANRYHAERLVRETSTIQKELKELRSKKIAVESELMYMSKQSIVFNMIEQNELGLTESVDPPIKITVEKKK